MLRRKAYDALMEWRGREGHKCLLVKGQRQVGKTFIIMEFGRRNYENVAYFDLSSDEGARSAFGIMSVDSIVSALKLRADGGIINPDTTLIVLDEIQSCPRARSALKLFTSDGRYDVVASGSLLGIRNPRKRNGRPRKAYGDFDLERCSIIEDEDDDDTLVLPMGYEEHLTMQSMDFEEFLWSRNVPQESIDSVRRCVHERIPLDTATLRAFDRHFRDFMIVGGMPKAVQAFVDSGGDYTSAGKEINSIISGCVEDIMGYNLPVDAIKIRQCFLSIPNQLGMGNKKFMYSRITDESRGTREKYDSSLLWMDQAGYVNPCYVLRNLAHPLSAYTDHSGFKVYMSDTGILNSLLGVESIRATYSGDTSYNMGAVVENAVAEGIAKSGIPVRFYQCTDNSEGKRMEIDFVLEFGDDIIAVEVKSGKIRRSPSLDKVQKAFGQVNRRVILGRTNIFVDDGGVEHYPLFVACFLEELAPAWDGPEFVAFIG